MSSVTHLETILKHILQERADELAKETGFVKRERKLTGADFAQLLIFGYLHNPQASLDQLTQAAQIRRIHISSSGLHQRCTQEAANFLQAVLSELVEQGVATQAAPIDLFKPFKQVIVEDSSTIVLPALLKEQWAFKCFSDEKIQQDFLGRLGKCLERADQKREVPTKDTCSIVLQPACKAALQ
ncbi:hypothetical protein KSC_000540 [Ktedonobacter sp. SOSP1-52]|uniref:hypothetical protein n=1 Tax=Ktedonobacter sp. SOSP1-52 TaxID=2778366 RepID=UPI001915F1A0|nr:hypothetical protein [Ktedonobacter sp. SOSP1-52]GHO61162.1 hypothetical protein KSC_000540 [Ktedonobacter sp. SOSP1-52]